MSFVTYFSSIATIAVVTVTAIVTVNDYSVIVAATPFLLSLFSFVTTEAVV